MTEKSFRILGIAGSLRRASRNRGLVRAAAEVAPPGVEVVPFDIGALPLLNLDLEASGDPEPVRALKDALYAADALLLATPEYNHSVPGVLKNAIDWASRSPARSALYHKPIALMGASPGMGGTMRAQAAWQQILTHAESYLLLRPEIFIPFAARHFDDEGNLVDPELRAQVRAQVAALVAWARLLEPRA
jgi:chromate reductase